MQPGGLPSGEAFAEYIDWRAEHPSDDLMTEMLNAEFEDETGVTRRLTREEILIYVNVIAGAGNETTTRLIGWAGKVLGDHPDQRRVLVEDRSLIPNAIEELLRYEPPAPHVARYVARDVEHYGRTVPEGSVMMLLVGAANRDDRRFPDGDRFDVRRERRAAPHLRLRGPLLPGCSARAPGGPGRTRRGLAAVPGVGRRPGAGAAGADVHRPGLGDAADRDPLSDAIEQFDIHVEDSVLEDLRGRLERTRLPDQIDGTSWEYGIPIGYVRELVEYWRDAYDWRAQEARLNELEHFRTRIDGQSIHFVHARSSRDGRAPADHHARVARFRRRVPRRHPAADRLGR